ncbi:sterile alpha motif domain-containing protein 9-like isoform X2 [Genypterus blacodes]|uniref:sterile alpha motif domain-containing protein 9-like isoform X2 n=1 Tax=Genypterus blacodes TaxID=154954 RepID=UPI003F762D7A
MDAKHKKRDNSPTCQSMRSDASKEAPPDLKPEKQESCHREADPAATSGLHAKTEDNDLTLPLLMEDWTAEQVKNWLTGTLRVPPQLAENLYDNEMSGACLVSYERQDLIDLGVPLARALQIIRQVEKFKKHSEIPNIRSHFEHREREVGKRPQRQDESAKLDESLEIETVSSDSGFRSLSSTALLLQEARDKIRSVISPKALSDDQLDKIIPDDTPLQMKGQICHIRPFDKSDPSISYTQNCILPPVTGPSNLLDPVHEYKLLQETSERELIYEFTKEVFCFAASCMNSRTNGTIHFGVNDQTRQVHGQVVEHKMSPYNEEFELCLNEYFQEQHIHTARMCIRPPKFIQVYCEDGTTSDKCVIEVDVVPTHSETQENIFYTLLKIASIDNKQPCKTECLFVREGQRSVNILAESNPRLIQEKMKSMNDKVKSLALARKDAEEREEKLGRLSHHNQGQRLKQLVTHGRDTLENSLQVIVVTDKCHSSKLEHLGFLKEMNLFAVLEFDPESDATGTCNFYRSDRIANIHYPPMFNTQESVSAIIGNLNLFKQTSWVFCNGRVNEDSESDKPLTTSEWLKKRSGDINNMISFLCNSDLLLKDRLLVVFILHSAVTDISSPILETFCAMYRTLEGPDNMMCICKDSAVFSHWKRLIDSRCKEDITSKCIFELSLYEISSTIKRLKEPQTQSSSRYLPSTGSSSVLLTKKDEELMTVLDILCQNECENTEIERNNESFKSFKTQVEEDYYRGGQVSWWNFYLSEKPGCLPFIKRDTYQELHDLITPTEGHTYPCVMINLFHHPGCGGTTLAMHVLWNLRSKFRCALVKNNMASNNDIANQVTDLLNLGKEEESSYTPVLLLVDNWHDVEDLKQCIVTAARERKRHSNLMIIILNCERTQFPAESSRNSRTPNVYITNKLSEKECRLFSEKLEQIKENHEKFKTFYAFMIMKNNFSNDYIEKLVNNTMKDLDITTQQGKLFSFLALLNTNVNGSYISHSLAKELVGIRSLAWRGESLQDKMNPYSSLLISFRVEEHGDYEAVRFLHQMIAEKCLEVLTQKYKLSLSEITINLLHCNDLYKSFLGKDFLVKNIQTMLITRQRKEQGDDKNTLFSPLIEAIFKDEGSNTCKEVLEKATVRFDKSATMPQALARHFYLRENDVKSALHWALDALGKKSNSYIADTVAQVHKSHFKMVLEDSEDLTPEVFSECLKLASNAVKAFRDSQELAKREDPADTLDLTYRKRQKSYNTSGYVGELEVMMTVLEEIKGIPLFNASERFKRDKMLQFLKGNLSASSWYDSNNTTTNQFVAVLKEHETFLVSLKPRSKEIFTFFESYFTYLKPRVMTERETIEERNKRKVSEFFKKYLLIFSLSKAEKADEKASKPKLSQRQEIEDQRHYLELKRADSFAGLLQCLSEKNALEMEHIVKKWQFVFDNSAGRYTSDTVNFILANIVLHSKKPSSDLLKKYEELVFLLDQALQKEGTHSSVTEMYYLAMLLLWPTKDGRPANSATNNNISTYVSSAKKSFHRRFSYMFPARSAIAHFFLGKSRELKRIVSKVNLDSICAERSSPQQYLHSLWQSGAVWKKKEVQEKLLRIKGISESGSICVNYGGNLKMKVRPAYLGDIRSGSSREDVSFYLGFTMEGPVAYDIRYETDQ